MRLEFQTPHMDMSQSVLAKAFETTVASRYQMNWTISYAAEKKRVVLLVSKHDHALMELLWRWSRDELPIDIPMVISNHDDLRSAVEGFNIPFHHIPVKPDNKKEAEDEIIQLVQDQADLIVLARYMQILSPEFVDAYPDKIINIHHSFLPAFVGANPYQQAYDKGVKLIGATSHYVTSDLDQGPIIEQGVIRVTHRDSPESLKSKGRDLERQVLARAVQWHVEDRVIVFGNKTIVFAK